MCGRGGGRERVGGGRHHLEELGEALARAVVGECDAVDALGWRHFADLVDGQRAGRVQRRGARAAKEVLRRRKGGEGEWEGDNHLEGRGWGDNHREGWWMEARGEVMGDEGGG